MVEIHQFDAIINYLSYRIILSMLFKDKARSCLQGLIANGFLDLDCTITIFAKVGIV
tara:strand:+ start:3251 stop:3421 length:171 start_codon:yes stop_codon:yes gene_type:complete